MQFRTIPTPYSSGSFLQYIVQRNVCLSLLNVLWTFFCKYIQLLCLDTTHFLCTTVLVATLISRTGWKIGVQLLTNDLVIQKTKAMIFTRKVDFFHVSVLRVSGIEISNVKKYKYLCCIPDCKLNEKSELNRIIISFDRMVGMFLRKFPTVELGLKLTLLNNFFYVSMGYKYTLIIEVVLMLWGNLLFPITMCRTAKLVPLGILVILPQWRIPRDVVDHAPPLLSRSRQLQHLCRRHATSATSRESIHKFDPWAYSPSPAFDFSHKA